jgi:hypothetical protein
MSVFAMSSNSQSVVVTHADASDYSLHPYNNPELIYPTVQASKLLQHTLYVSLQPCDLGIGLRYDYRFTTKVIKSNPVKSFTKHGLYVSITHGNYNFLGGYIDDHWKLSGGYVYYLNYIMDCFGGSQSFVTLGLNYHHYGKYIDEFELLDNYKAFKPLSVDIGSGLNIGKFVLCIRFDTKIDGAIDFGLNF